jgi:hypothetical protein
MSTDADQPTAAPVATVPAEPGAPYLGAGSAGEEPEPGWFDRNATLVIAVSVAVIAVAAALVTLFFYRESLAEADEDTEAAVSDFVEEQGGAVESVQCAGGSCTAIVDGAAYSVLVHEDEDGEQTFGVSAYAGN